MKISIYQNMASILDVFLWIWEIKQIYTPGGLYVYVTSVMDMMNLKLTMKSNLLLKMDFFLYIFKSVVKPIYVRETKFMQMMRHYKKKIFLVVILWCLGY